MPASKVNYLILYEHDPQVYGCARKDIALSTPPPEGFTIEEKMVYFVTVEPDNGQLVWRRLPQEEVESAELKLKKEKEPSDESQA